MKMNMKEMMMTMKFDAVDLLTGAAVVLVSRLILIGADLGGVLWQLGTALSVVTTAVIPILCPIDHSLEVVKQTNSSLRPFLLRFVTHKV